MNHSIISSNQTIQNIQVLQQAAKAQFVQSQLSETIKRLQASACKNLLHELLHQQAISAQAVKQCQIYPSQQQQHLPLQPNQFLFKHCIQEQEQCDEKQLILKELKSQINTALHGKVETQQLERFFEVMNNRLEDLSLHRLPNYEIEIPMTTHAKSSSNELGKLSHQYDVSTCGSKSHDENTYDSGELPQENKEALLDPEVEKEFSVNVQKKRKRLLEVLSTKRTLEIVIKPHQKVFKGENVSNFRGSKFRGISKNGNSWQILVMVNRKKKYLGTLPTEEQAAKFYDKVAVQFQGHKAKTNFAYSKQQIQQILKLKPLL